MSTPNVMFGMRRAGKTTALVKAFLADPRGVLVMPSSGDAARVIIDHNLHHVGGRVVTWDEVVRGRRMPYGMKLYVDDLDRCLDLAMVTMTADPVPAYQSPKRPIVLPLPAMAPLSHEEVEASISELKVLVDVG